MSYKTAQSTAAFRQARSGLPLGHFKKDKFTL